MIHPLPTFSTQQLLSHDSSTAGMTSRGPINEPIQSQSSMLRGARNPPNARYTGHSPS